AFQNCAALDIAIPANDYEKISWGTYVFSGCTNLGKTYDVVIPSALTKIGAGLFQNCENLKVTRTFIPETVTDIGADAFSGCTAKEFTAIVIPSLVTNIGNNAFKGCKNIQTVDLYTNVVTKIGDYAFADCEQIKNFVVPTSVTTLGKGAFSGCSSLKSATLSGTKITAIPDYAFMNCYSLTTIDIPDGYISGNTIIPFKTIGKFAFAGCRKLGINSTGDLQTVVIPTTTTSIGESAFDCCESLTYIVIPVSVTTLGKSAFANCTALEAAIVLPNPTMTTTFAGDENLRIFTYSTCKNVITYARNNHISFEYLAGSNGTYIAVLKHPENWTSAKVGDTAEFKVRAVSDGALHYTWYTKKQGDSEYVKSNETGDTLTVNVTADTMGMAVYCMIDETKTEADTEVINSINTDVAYVTSMNELKISSISKMGVISWNKVTGADEYHVYRADTEDGARTELAVITDNSVTSYTDVTAKDGSTYYYFVSAVSNSTGVTLTTSPKYVTIDKVAGVTTITSAEPDDGIVTLTWEKIDLATQYRVQRLVDSEWTTIATVTTTTYVDSGLTNGTTYSYRVLCYVNSVWKDPSEVVTATPAVPNIIPQNVAADADDGSVTITWDTVKKATKYRIQRLNGTSWTTISSPTTNSYTDTNVVNGTKYSYRVLAYVNSTWSGVSEVVSATPAVPNIIPQNVTANVDDNQVSVTWDAVKNATKYRVQRLNGSTWSTVATTETPGYVDVDVSEGNSYSYRVLAYVNSTWSGVSAVASAEIPVSNPVPQNVKAVGGDSKVVVGWDKVGGATKYRVQRLNGTSWATVGTVTTNSFTDTSVTNDTSYSYRVLSYVNSAWSSVSQSASAIPSAAPQGVKATADNCRIVLSWDTYADATKYRVQRIAGDETSWTTIGTCVDASYTDSGLTNGTKYRYRVLAQVNGSWTSASASSSATPTSVPQELKIAANNKQAIISWNVVDGAKRYRIQRLNDSSWTTIGYSNTASYVDSGLTNGTKYSYRILAEVAEGWSSPTAGISVTPTNAPQNVQISSSNGKVTLTWDEVDGAKRYRVQRLNGTVWTSIYYPTTNSFTDSDVTAGNKYSYRVLAEVEEGWGSGSKIISASVN
ncbi:MAG: leucine-rich repeat protein, partial [Oscillospiraceae bacterium]